MIEQIVGILLDVGLGALAYNLARSLKASVASNSATLQGLLKVTEDHEHRIKRLETDVDMDPVSLEKVH